jgi:GNAT superfamily N-acetyltransferase
LWYYFYVVLKEKLSPTPAETKKPPSKPSLVSKWLGRTGVRSAELEDQERAPLPEGYHYVDRRHIKPGELNGLNHRAGWTHTTHKDAWLQLRGKLSGGQQEIIVGVRNKDGGLVGFGGLIYRGDQGEPGDFAVDPDFRSQGIGKAIIDERLRLAEKEGITSLYMPYLEPTNTLRSYYIEKGFRETPAGEVVRGPNPAPLNPVPADSQPVPAGGN